MDKLKWKLLTEVHGRMQAELLKSYLEAEGIGVEIIQEGIGHNIYPVMNGALSLVQFFVPPEQIGEAKKLVAEYNKADGTK